MVRNTEKKYEHAIALIFTPLLLIMLFIGGIFIKGYYLRLLTSIYMFIVVAQAINLMMGFMGYIPFGQAAFFGVGGYVAGLLMNRGFPLWLTFAAVVIIASIFCVVFGAPLLRLRGAYFAVGTSAFSAAMSAIALNASRLTGGAGGLSFPILPLAPEALYRIFYYIMLSLLVVTFITITIISKTRIGYAIRAIKADEDAAATLGINTTLYKVLTWAISASFTALAGAFYGWWMTYIHPLEVFNINLAVVSIVSVLLGGSGTLFGPIIGGAVIQTISEVAWSKFLEYHYLILGTLIILIVLFVPQGLMTRFRGEAHGK
jgi:branched-chain amino acid transport system permease protein